MMTVETRITLEEFGGPPISIPEPEVLVVRSHREDPRKVVVCVGEFEYTVDAQELVRAVTSAWHA
jgi:hypothetical protein